MDGGPVEGQTQPVTRTLKAMLIRRIAGLLLVLGLFPATLAGQDPEGVRLGLLYQSVYQPGLVVLPFAPEPGVEDLARPIHTIIRQDMEFSDRFEVLNPGPAIPGDSVNLPLWKERGADWVINGSLSPGERGGTLLRLTLYDAVFGQRRAEEVFELPAQGDPNFRMAVHAVSDEVVMWATGTPGAAATRIAFVLESRGGKEIYTIDYDGENVQRVTNEGEQALVLSPAWSPDGSRLAYLSYRTGAPYLYERDLRTGQDRMISDRQGLNATPEYSPDGQVIAFATTVAGNTEIATYDIGRNCCLEQHTRGRNYDSLSPTYSPDGRRFAFESNRLGEPHIYVMPVGGGEARLISDYSYGGRGYNTSPDWSPRGNQIVYQTRVSNGTMQLMVADLDEGTRRLLTNDGTNEDPSWGPDGRHVVFSSRDREGGGLFILDTVSGRIRPLLRGSGYGLPAWSPRVQEAVVSRATR